MKKVLLSRPAVAQKRTASMMRRVTCVAVAVALGCFGLVGCSSSDSGSNGSASSASSSTSAATTTSHEVKDMAGRTVELPAQIKSVATFGSVGVLNAFVECMGKGDLIVNQMPANFTKNDKWKMQYVFAPQIADGPVLETADGLDMEAIMQLNPDLCITMTEDTAQQLAENGLNVVVLQWGNTEDVKVAVELMGEIFGVQDRADDYNAYFDKMVKKANDLTQDIPSAQRPTVIYGDVTTLTNPHIISEWWVEAAGGVSVTAEAHDKNSLEYTMEQLLAWQPQVIFSSNSKLSDIYADANLATLPAIQDKKVYAVPTVAHTWGNRTVEQPLTVMWALNKLYPEKYSTDELSEDIEYYYDHFFGYKMSDDEIASIIDYE